MRKPARPRLCGVYKIVNGVTGEFYVGKCEDIERRFKQHFDQLARRVHPNPLLQASYNKHGSDAFKTEIIQLVNTGSRDLFLTEFRLIGKLKPAFNLSGPHLPHHRKGKRYPGHSEKMKAYWVRRKADPRGIGNLPGC